MLAHQTVDHGSDIAASSAGLRAAEDAVNRSAGAFWNWAQRPGTERADILCAMADALVEHRSDLVELAAEEVGAAAQWTDFNIRIAKETLMQARALPPLMEDQTVTHADGRRSTIRRQAVGVVLGFAPWNAPIILAARAIASPLACGNTVVLKASEHCPKTHEHLVSLFIAAGVPSDVVNVVTNDPRESLDVAKLLIGNPAVRRINFTGSTRVGQQVAIEAAKFMKRCLLELSGKAPLIVLDDADLEAATSAAATGAFFNQGQVCMSTERIVVLDSVADAFVEKLHAKARVIRAADPSVQAATLGRLINQDAGHRIAALIEDAVDNGATLLCGGELSGAVMQPAVLDNVTPNMRIYAEESFGPVASIIRVPGIEEAVSVANDTEFGLAAAVFGTDLKRCHAVADRLETGICQINGPTVFDDPSMPFGGMKASGYGRFGGMTGLDEFTETRWISQHDNLDAAQIDNMLNLGRT